MQLHHELKFPLRDCLRYSADITDMDRVALATAAFYNNPDANTLELTLTQVHV